jgi:hypothetical protein
MDYSIWSQGVDSDEYAVVIEDGVVLEKDDPRRASIRAFLETAKHRGRNLISKDDVNILEYKDRLLIEAISDNTDRLGRHVPVSIMVDSTVLASIAEVINTSLDEGGLRVKVVNTNLLLEALDKSRHRKKRLPIAVALGTAFMLVILLLYYFLL